MPPVGAEPSTSCALPVPGRPTFWMIVGQGPIALAVGAGGGSLDIFTLLYPISPLSPSLWETARYRLKYCLKGPLNPKQPTNQILRPILRLQEAKTSGLVYTLCSIWTIAFVILGVSGLSCRFYSSFYGNTADRKPC